MTRACSCPHGFPLCCCGEGRQGDDLLQRSRLASAVAGWPTRLLATAAVEAHNARMAAARRDRKLRLPLGTRPPAPPDCVPCREREGR